MKEVDKNAICFISKLYFDRSSEKYYIATKKHYAKLHHKIHLHSHEVRVNLHCQLDGIVNHMEINLWRWLHGLTEVENATLMCTAQDSPSDRKKEVGRGWEFFSFSLLTSDAVDLPASCDLHRVYHARMDWNLKLWTKINLSLSS